MTEEVFALALEKAAKRHGIDPPPGFPQLCFRHVSLMLEWNRRTNLTRITDIDDILNRHVLDSLLPSQWLPSSGTAMDIGSGAGFPGVVLALALPELHMTLIEAARKKASFLRVLSSRLAVSNLSVFQGTWQEWLYSTPAQPSVDCVTMRAVRLEKAHLEELALKSLRPGGVFAYWAGPEAKREEDLSQGSPGSPKLRMLPPIPYSLPNGKGERRLLRWLRED